MDLIALRDFRRTPDLKDIEVQGAIHENHIHMGATFSIGTAKELKDLSVRDRQLVAHLAFAKCVGDATDPKVVKAVKEEIAVNERREKNAAKLNAAADSSALVAQLTALVAKAAAAGAK